jgi:hypothetical protein
MLEVLRSVDASLFHVTAATMDSYSNDRNYCPQTNLAQGPIFDIDGGSWDTD